MAIPDSVKQHASNAINDAQALFRDAISDIGNTYRAVHMQHTGWISSGRYYHLDSNQEVAQQEANQEEEKSLIQAPEIGPPGQDGPEPPEGPEDH
jgi:hypothetical protein